MQLRKGVRHGILFLAVVSAMGSCTFMKKKPQQDSATGLNYNDKDTKNNYNFNVAKPSASMTPPGTVFIQGGTFSMGSTQEDVMRDWNNALRRVTVNSFFIDKTEVSNVNYRMYLFWVEHVFGSGNNTPGSYEEEIIDGEKPDTLVWRSELSYNEPYVEYYFRHPSFNYYPVVGVSWNQADHYCKWRSDRVNEHKLMEKNKQYIDPKSVVGLVKNGYNNDSTQIFSTKAYLLGAYDHKGKFATSKANPLTTPDGKARPIVKIEDGIIFPDYRLPTEAEWEYAALALQNPLPKRGKKRGEEVVLDKRIYSWRNDGFDNLRSTVNGSYQGAFLANFKRGSGDYMGVAGGLNDNAAYTSEVTSFAPNEFGLYNMSGNVSEWVNDTYRPLTSNDANDLNPYRGNEFKIVAKDSTSSGGYLRDKFGRIKMVLQSDTSLRNRRNYQHAYALDHMDGDTSSGNNYSYGYGKTTLISNKSKVVKGGSWNDKAYWISPGARRFLEEDQSSATIGFRCAMDHFGSQEGLSKNAKTGNFFPSRRAKK